MHRFLTITVNFLLVFFVSHASGTEFLIACSPAVCCDVGGEVRVIRSAGKLEGLMTGGIVESIRFEPDFSFVQVEDKCEMRVVGVDRFNPAKKLIITLMPGREKDRLAVFKNEFPVVDNSSKMSEVECSVMDTQLLQRLKDCR